MKIHFILSLVMGALAFGTCKSWATPVTINLYETANNTSSGVQTETGGWISLPAAITVNHGFIIINEPGDNGHGQPHWSDVLQFSSDGLSVRLLSRNDDGSANPAWPSESDVEPHPVIINEDLSGLATYAADILTLIVHSDEPPAGNPIATASAPDAGTTWVLLAIGVSALGLCARFQRSSAA